MTFIIGRIDKKEIRVEYCPTSKMLADFFTTLDQGNLFKFFKSIIMGHMPIDNLFFDDDSPMGNHFMELGVPILNQGI